MSVVLKEILGIISQICEEHSDCGTNCDKDCPFSGNGVNCIKWRAEHTEETIRICANWDAEQRRIAEEKRLNPKMKWVDVCRIIEVKNNIKKCVYEEQIILPLSNFSATALYEKAEEILKKYVIEHDGEFFVSIEHNCRVVR